MRKRSWWLASNGAAHACASPGLMAWFCPDFTKTTWWKGSPICEIYIVLLQEAEGEGHGFAGGLAVALWHPWAGTASASSFLLSPCLHSCCSGTQAITAPW